MNRFRIAKKSLLGFFVCVALCVLFCSCEVQWNENIKNDMHASFSSTYTFFCQIDGTESFSDEGALSYDMASVSRLSVSYDIGDSIKQEDLLSLEKVRSLKPGYNLLSWHYFFSPEPSFDAQDYYGDIKSEKVISAPSNFSVDSDGAIVSVKVTPERACLYGVWEVRTDMPYKVRHYIQQKEKDELGNSVFTLYEEENLEGTTFELTAASSKEIEGYEAEPFLQQTISEYGTTVISIYYIRNISVDSGTKTTVEEIFSDKDIEIQTITNKTAKTLTFTVKDTSYDSYTWIFNGDYIEQKSGTSVVYDYSDYGTYELVLIFTSGSVSYSAQFEITISREEL